MSTPRRTGIVIEFDEHVGLGSVRDELGEEFFFHCTEITDGTRRIEIGAAVSFAVSPAHKGLYQATALYALSASMP